MKPGMLWVDGRGCAQFSCIMLLSGHVFHSWSRHVAVLYPDPLRIQGGDLVLESIGRTLSLAAVYRTTRLTHRG